MGLFFEIDSKSFNYFVPREESSAVKGERNPM